MVKKKTVTKADLVDLLADKSNFKKKDIHEVIDLLIDEISISLDKGGKVQITGFGTFEVRTRKARTGVRPGTEERIKIPASKYPAFKAGKALKDKIRE